MLIGGEGFVFRAGSVVDPNHVDADPDPHREKRIRIQLLVNDFCKFIPILFYISCLYLRFLSMRIRILT